MTGRTYLAISCDGVEGDPFGCFEYHGAWHRTITAVRKDAAESGWTSRQGKDYCREHSLAREGGDHGAVRDPCGRIGCGSLWKQAGHDHP